MGSPNGALLANGGSTGIAMTGDWVSNKLSFFLVDQNTKQVLASTTVYTVPTPPPGQGVLNIVPDPITPPPGTALGQAQLIWNAPGFAQVQIRVGSPQGPVMANGGSEGIAATGMWVSNGLTFFLVDASGNTLATATAQLNWLPGSLPSPRGTLRFASLRRIEHRMQPTNHCLVSPRKGV